MLEAEHVIDGAGVGSGAGEFDIVPGDSHERQQGDMLERTSQEWSEDTKRPNDIQISTPSSTEYTKSRILQYLYCLNPIVFRHQYRLREEVSTVQENGHQYPWSLPIWVLAPRVALANITLR